MSIFIILALGVFICGAWKTYMMVHINGMSNHQQYDMKIELPLNIGYTMGLLILLINLYLQNVSIDLIPIDHGPLLFMTWILLIFWYPYTVSYVYGIAKNLTRIQERRYVRNKCDANKALIMSIVFILPGMVYVTKYDRM